MVAFGNDTAILEGGRCFRVHRCIDAGLDVLQRVDLCCQLGKLRAAAGFSLPAQAGQTVAGLGQRIDLLGCGRAIDRPGHQAFHVRNVVQLFHKIAPGHGLLYQTFHSVQAVVDECAGNKRLFDPAAQHTLAHGGAGLIQHPEQRPPLFAAAQGLGQFQIGACHRREPHELCLVVADDRFQTLDALDLGIVEVFQKRCHGKAHKAIGGNAGGLRPVAAKLIFQRCRHKARRIAFLLDQLHRTGHVLFDVRRHLAAVQKARIHQNFAGMIAAQLRDHSRCRFIRVQLGDMRRAGGDICKAQARLLSLEEDAGNVVIAVVLQHAALNDRAGRDHTDDVPLDKALGFGRVFHLLTDGHLVALGDQPGHIAFVAVEGHTAHGRTLGLTALLAGQSQIQLFGCREGIIVEHLVKVTDAVKENFVFMLFFDLKILLHHGRQLCHVISLSRSVHSLRLVTAAANKTRSVLHSRVLSKFLARKSFSSRIPRQPAKNQAAAVLPEESTGTPVFMRYEMNFSVAAAAGGTAAGAGSRRLLYRHGVAAIHGSVDDGINIVHKVLAVTLGLVVSHHAFVAHDLAVQAVHLLVQLGDAGIVALALADLVVQIHAGEVELADQVLQLFVLIVCLAGLIQNEVAAIGLQRNGCALEKINAIHLNGLLLIYTFRGTAPESLRQAHPAAQSPVRP